MARTFKQGVLIYDVKAQRMDIRLDLDNYCGGLCCGQCIEVLFDGRWISTRIEMADDCTWSMYRLGIWSGSGCVFLCNGQRMGFMVFLQTERGIFHWSLRRLYGSND